MPTARRMSRFPGKSGAALTTRRGAARADSGEKGRTTETHALRGPRIPTCSAPGTLTRGCLGPGTWNGQAPRMNVLCGGRGPRRARTRWSVPHPRTVGKAPRRAKTRWSVPPAPPFQAVWSKSFPFLGPRPGRVQDTSLRFTALCLEVRDLVRHRAQVLTVRRGHYHGCTRAPAKRRSSGTFQTSI